MKETKTLWILIGTVLLTTFLILGFVGRELYRKVPPIPLEVVSPSGEVIMTQENILQGQQAWQSMGGQQVGSIWGHGAYQAPDWSADWLHREALALRDILSLKRFNARFQDLDTVDQAGVLQLVQDEMRTNTHDPKTGRLVISHERIQAIARVAPHYLALFGDDPSLADLRESYALHENALPERSRRQNIAKFFFWTAWASAAKRPGIEASYTNNWPHEPLVGNRITAANVIWSLVSIVLLIAGVGGMIWYKLFKEKDEPPAVPDAEDPLDQFTATPSMLAVGKYAVTVILLLLAQVGLGGLTAHYTVEGDQFFGIPIGQILPYAVTRTWHVQLGVFWIATAFLGAGLFLAPAVGGREPKFQRFGVNFLFGALLLVVTGSLVGEWLSVQQFFSLDAGFWFGHQGYEYVDLGRFWQILLFVGLVLWLVLMLRGLWPAFQRPGHRRQLVLLFAGASAAIGLFYGAGFFYGSKTHLTIMEYWRWWVVHLWVEGFFEVFATAAIAFIFTRLGLVRSLSAVRAVLFSSAIYLVGGIPGTFHHLYFSGTPISVMAVGASFSALEVVPLALIGYEAYETHEKLEMAAWMEKYRWPIKFFMGVAFWNLVGAGIFGFLINPPISLYYVQGLNTTPVHAHTALFGVYGFLALGLVLLVFRRLFPNGVWRDDLLGIAFWGMNWGLVLMVGLSLLPIGLIQAWASVEHGMWYARSAEFLQQPHMEVLRWLRLIGDGVFMAAVGVLAYFILGLFTGWAFKKN